MCAHIYVTVCYVCTYVFLFNAKKKHRNEWQYGNGDPDELLSDLKRQSDMQIYTY